MAVASLGAEAQLAIVRKSGRAQGREGRYDEQDNREGPLERFHAFNLATRRFVPSHDPGPHVILKGGYGVFASFVKASRLSSSERRPLLLLRSTTKYEMCGVPCFCSVPQVGGGCSLG